MLEPAIIEWGRQNKSEYGVNEYIESLTRAFKEKRASYVVLDDNMRGQKFLAACTAWAIDHGWLYCDKTQSDSQETVSTFRLTEAGKKAILK